MITKDDFFFFLYFKMDNIMKCIELFITVLQIFRFLMIHNFKNDICGNFHHELIHLNHFLKLPYSMNRFSLQGLLFSQICISISNFSIFNIYKYSKLFCYFLKKNIQQRIGKKKSRQEKEDEQRNTHNSWLTKGFFKMGTIWEMIQTNRKQSTNIIGSFQIMKD